MKFKFGIRQKIFSILLLLILFFAGYSILNFYYLDQNQEATHQTSTVIQPSIISLGELQTMVAQSKDYTKSWVNTQVEDYNDKWSLRAIQNEGFPKLSEQIGDLSKEWLHKSDKDSLNNILLLVQEIQDEQKLIMNRLAKFEDYDDMYNKIEAESIAEDVASKCELVIVQIQNLLEIQKERTRESLAQVNQTYENMRFSGLYIGIGVILISLIVAFFLARSITRPLVQLQQVVKQLGKGELPEQQLSTGDDEVGEMSREVTNLMDGLRQTAQFANEIGRGELDAQYKALGHNDMLGNALLSMRENLKVVALEDERRNWANEGYAKFSEILRNNEGSNLKDLSSNIVSSLVKYLNVNQGWLYIVNQRGDETDQEVLTLTGVFAYDQSKFVNQELEKGEGLTGQCWQEGERIYMNDVPDDYVSITSGLGTASPRSILIVPLKVNDEIYGIIEFASFQDIEKHEVEFIERVSENIASTISVTKINERTKKLLEDSQSLTQNLKTQEEEMRQNFEELQSTQEELARRERDKDKELEETKKLLNAEIKTLKSELAKARQS